MRGRGFKVRQPRKGGSHYFYSREDGTRFTVVRPHGKKKTVDKGAVADVLERLGPELEEEKKDGED